MFLCHFFEFSKQLHPSFSQPTFQHEKSHLSIRFMHAVRVLHEVLLFSASSSYITVVAIDFGTTYSGFAFAPTTRREKEASI